MQVYKVLTQAKAKGFSDVLFLDPVNGRYIEEGSASNIFILMVRLIRYLNNLFTE